MPIKAIVFDLDGLMVDSEPIAEQAWSTLLERHGYQVDREAIEAIIGLKLADSSRIIQARFDLPLTVEQIGAEKTRIFTAMLEGNLHPMPGLNELLKVIDERGLLRAVATSSDRSYARLALECVGIENGFFAVITGDLVSHGKPAPDIYLAAAKALSLPPAQCLALEDSPFGVQAAKAAGMRCVAIPNAMTSRMDLGTADWILPSLQVVAERLDTLIAG